MSDYAKAFLLGLALAALWGAMQCLAERGRAWRAAHCAHVVRHPVVEDSPGAYPMPDLVAHRCWCGTYTEPLLV